MTRQKALKKPAYIVKPTPFKKFGLTLDYDDNDKLVIGSKYPRALGLYESRIVLDWIARFINYRKNMDNEMDVSIYDICIKLILTNEGYYRKDRGFFNHPNDAGGHTLGGITHAVYAKYLGVDFVTVERLKKITDAEIADIYRTLYWDKHNLFALNQTAIAAACFDAGVNFGGRWGVKFLQKAINDMIPTSKAIKVDGVLGIKTAAFANTLVYWKLFILIEMYADKRYNQLSKKGSKNEVFRMGWQNRVDNNRAWLCSTHWTPGA